MKRVLAVLFLIAALFLLTGCGTGTGPIGKVTTAKIRYFDGSMDTLVLREYRYLGGGVLRLVTEDGNAVIIGANNVILVEEDE